MSVAQIPMAVLGELIETITPPQKIPKSEYGSYGRFPIIDQSQNEIAGWTDNEEILVKQDKPLVIFGDHTCNVKYSETPFVQGADGVKILKTKDSLIPKFLYYILKIRPLESDGYKRHFTKLKSSKIPLPPLAEQKRIAARLDAAFAEIDAAIASAERERADFGNLKNAILKAEFDNGNAENWATAQLGEVCDISAGNPAPQGDFNFINGKYPFYRTYDVGRAHRSPNLKDVRDWLNEDGIKGLKKFNKGTILFPKSGASTLLNHRAIMGYDGYVSPHLATISPRETKILGLFAYMCLLNVDAKILIAGQDYPSLRIGKIAQIKIPLPPLAEQRRIAARLEEAFEQVEIGLSSVAKRLTEYKALKAALLRSHLNGGAA